MASKRIYRLAPLAEDDLEAIWLYSAQRWSGRKANQYLADMIVAFSDLADGRRHGSTVTTRAGYYRLLVHSHTIYYRVTPERIDVIRILHQSMDAKRHLT